MASTIGLFGYIVLLALAVFIGVLWILMPIAVFGIRNRLDKIIDLMSQK